jgi:hypothetical protein
MECRQRRSTRKLVHTTWRESVEGIFVENKHPGVISSKDAARKD